MISIGRNYIKNILWKSGAALTTAVAVSWFALEGRRPVQK